MSSAPPDFTMRRAVTIVTQTFRIVDSRRHTLLYSYGPDWLLTVLFMSIPWWLDSVGYRQDFSLEDKSIQYRYRQEQIPPWVLFIIAFSPLVFMPVVNYLTVRSFWDMHNSSLGLSLGVSLTATITQIVKVTVGEARPDLIDRCQPAPGAADAPIYGLSNSSVCTQQNVALLRDGFRSFPSGHSGISFAGLGFLSFYLAGKLQVWDRQGYSGKVWLSLSPLIGAMLISITRIMDHRHHLHDVVGGASLGLVVSYFSYRQYFPAPFDEHSDSTYDFRVDLNSERLIDLEARMD